MGLIIILFSYSKEFFNIRSELLNHATLDLREDKNTNLYIVTHDFGFSDAALVYYELLRSHDKEDLRFITTKGLKSVSKFLPLPQSGFIFTDKGKSTNTVKRVMSEIDKGKIVVMFVDKKWSGRKGSHAIGSHENVKMSTISVKGEVSWVTPNKFSFSLSRYLSGYDRRANFTLIIKDFEKMEQESPEEMNTRLFKQLYN